MSSFHSAAAEQTDEIENRRRDVAALLAARLPYREIGRRLGVSVGTVARDVEKIRRTWQDRYAEDYNAHASEQLATLDIVKQRLLPRVLVGGKPEEEIVEGRPTGRTVPTMDLWALDRLLGVMDREARLLGLDAPQRIEVQMHVEVVAKAIEHVVIELGLDPDVVRPVLGAKLRELGAISETGRVGNGAR